MSLNRNIWIILCYFGLDPILTETSLPHFELELDSASSVGPQDQNEKILAVVFATDSSVPQGDISLAIRYFGYSIFGDSMIYSLISWFKNILLYKMSVSQLLSQNNYELYCKKINSDEISIDKVSIDGSDDVNKLSIKDQDSNTIFNVDTVNDEVSIQGSLDTENIKSDNDLITTVSNDYNLTSR